MYVSSEWIFLPLLLARAALVGVRTAPLQPRQGQTDPPTKTVLEQFPEKNFPEGQIMEYSDELSSPTPVFLWCSHFWPLEALSCAQVFSVGRAGVPV